MKAVVVGSLNLQTHVATDFNVTLAGVYVTEGIDFNLLYLHDAKKTQTISLDKHGMHLFDNRLSDIPSCSDRFPPVCDTSSPDLCEDDYYCACDFSWFHCPPAPCDRFPSRLSV